MEPSPSNSIPSTAASRRLPDGQPGVPGGPETGAAPPAKRRDVRDVPSIRLLVIEDDAIVASLLTEALTRLGYDVCTTAATESAAVVAAARFDPNLTIVYVKLKAGSGIVAVATARQDGVEDASAPGFLMIAGAIRLVSDDTVVSRQPSREADIVPATDRMVGFSTQPLP